MLNEHDVEAYKSDGYYQPESKEIKLYELQRGDLFAFADALNKVFKMHRIDGAYSYVTGESSNVKYAEDGTHAIYHISAWAPVIKMKVKEDEPE